MKKQNEHIKKISFDDIDKKMFNDKTINIYDRGIYYGYFADNKLVSIINIIDKGNYIETSDNMTLPKYRRKGYFTELLKFTLEKYNGRVFKAECLEPSYGIYLKLGFEQTKVRVFKNWVKHYMIKK